MCTFTIYYSLIIHSSKNFDISSTLEEFWMKIQDYRLNKKKKKRIVEEK